MAVLIACEHPHRNYTPVSPCHANSVFRVDRAVQNVPGGYRRCQKPCRT
jgi:hypothetical protein